VGDGDYGRGLRRILMIASSKARVPTETIFVELAARPKLNCLTIWVMRFSAYSACTLLLAASAEFAQSVSAPKPPGAEKIHTEKPINGAVLVDDYGWLRERTNPRVREYLEAENAYGDQAIAGEAPFAEKLYNETLSHIKQTDTTVPYRKHGY